MPRQEIETPTFSWIDITFPAEADMKYLSERFGFHELDLEDCMSNIQRPKIDQYQDYLFIVMHFPRYFKGSKRLVLSEVDIFIGKNYFITVHNGSQKLLNQLFSKCQQDKAVFQEYAGKGSGMLLYEVISLLYGNSYKMIDKIYERIENLDSEIFSAKKKPRVMIQELSRLRREIINFRRIMKPQREVVGQMENLKTAFIGKDVEVYFDDVGDMIEKIWDLLENQKEITDSLNSTYESLVSNQTNDIIKILTIFTAIMLPVTLVSGIYGMNIENLPFAGTGFAMEFISGIMLLIAIMMIAFFMKKRWL